MVLPNKITQIYQTRISIHDLYIFYCQIRYHIKHNIQDRILGTFMLRQVFFVYDLLHLSHLTFEELVELWLWDLGILFKTGMSGGNGNICSSCL